MIGQELGGRYEIIDRIGGGGMALVYKGHDLLLHRKVAIKVLREQYVHDEEFIQRFQREAQAAASLSHPNVVSIYDVGREGDIHYIVMEYIEGQTLNERIKEQAPLQVEEAVHIASQICDALDHAHQNQIIHRDIKPHNILIGKNGRVKVTDFGIARAADASQITQTGSVVGSVHYFSPEHAKGSSTGAKSDIYSLGIVMYQMLTAQLPFLGESPISVALKHLQENFDEPRKVNPLIPQSVENIIVKAMRKNPEERYMSARQMLDDLESCLAPERRNESKLQFFDDDDQEETRIIPALRSGQYADNEAEGREYGRHSGKASRKRGWLKPVVLLSITALLLLGMWLGIRTLSGMFDEDEVEVPNVVNKTIQEAEAMLLANNLRWTAVPKFQEGVPKDVVVEQRPLGMKVTANSEITLYVSTGPETESMPGFVGKMINDAKLELIALGVDESQIEVEEMHIDDPDVGKILRQTPAAGEEFDPKTVSVQFMVSKGREIVEMPDLIGDTEVEAKSRITVAGLVLKPENIIRQPSYKQPKGHVFDQWPYDPNTPVKQGEEVKIFVSTGLPEDAGELKVSLPVSPSAEGQESNIRILLSDARYDNFEYTTKTISKVENFEVRVVVSRDKNAVIQVYRDNELINSKTVTYKDLSANNKETSAENTGQATENENRPVSGENSPTPTPTGGGNTNAESARSQTGGGN